MEIEYFEQAAALLFGDYWIIPMARALGVDRRTIYKWKDRRAVPEDAGVKVKQLMADRRAAIRVHERGWRAATKALAARL